MPTMEVRRWGVSELTRYIRQLLDQDYRLQELEVEGEVSNWHVHGSGHAYFTLKDEKAQLQCVMWRSAVQAQTYLPQQGDRVFARGSISVYEAGGLYQLYCQSLHPAGLGDLYLRFEQLKALFQAEGLFAPERKRPLPAYPRTIGIVTSPSAAALQDVLNILRRRYPLARVLLSPTAVQGEQAPPQIIAALAALNARPDVDVILIVRGGGSLEDLWCFNDEQVVRAIASSRVPVVAGIGHEIDFTLADFAADLRAPTPSAAAEIATPVTIDHLIGRVEAVRERLASAAMANLGQRRREVQQLAGRLRRLSPASWINNNRQLLDTLSSRACRAAVHYLNLQRAQIAGLRQMLTAIGPEATLKRGYAIVFDSDGYIVRRAADVPAGSSIRIQLYQGRLLATVEGEEGD